MRRCCKANFKCPDAVNDGVLGEFKQTTPKSHRIFNYGAAQIFSKFVEMSDHM